MSMYSLTKNFQLRVYLRTYGLEQMVQAASSSAGLRTIKRVEQTLQDLGVCFFSIMHLFCCICTLEPRWRLSWPRFFTHHQKCYLSCPMIKTCAVGVPFYMWIKFCYIVKSQLSKYPDLYCQITILRVAQVLHFLPSILLFLSTFLFFLVPLCLTVL